MVLHTRRKQPQAIVSNALPLIASIAIAWGRT
jgi:hypothetical protein